MRSSLFLVMITVLFFPCIAAGLQQDASSEETRISGTVTDIQGNAVQGAMVFLYNNSDVNRSADFISPPTDSSGSYGLAVPAGAYWAVARFKKVVEEEFGPLMPGDRHSGDPLEVEAAPGSTVSADFTIADLREAIRLKKESLDRPLKITGKILDEKGKPLPHAYVIAYEKEQITRFPDFLSAWADKEGNYTLYVPEGSYFVGVAETFPQENNYFITGNMTFGADESGRDIVKQKPENK